MITDIFYMVEHKRLRETYKWETILRHEQKIMAALRSRHEAQLRLHMDGGNGAARQALSTPKVLSAGRSGSRRRQ